MSTTPFVMASQNNSPKESSPLARISIDKRPATPIIRPIDHDDFIVVNLTNYNNEPILPVPALDLDSYEIDSETEETPAEQIAALKDPVAQLISRLRTSQMNESSLRSQFDQIKTRNEAILREVSQIKCRAKQGNSNTNKHMQLFVAHNRLRAENKNLRDEVKNRWTLLKKLRDENEVARRQAVRYWEKYEDLRKEVESEKVMELEERVREGLMRRFWGG